MGEWVEKHSHRGKGTGGDGGWDGGWCCGGFTGNGISFEMLTKKMINKNIKIQKKKKSL